MVMDTDDVFKLALAFLCIALNGYFVIAEFALVKVRRSRLEEMVKEKVRNAELALKMTASIDTYLSATQLGITLASLALGWLGEPAVASLIREPLLKYLGLGEIATHTISVVIAFTAITLCHVVFGEQAPKLYAIARCDRMVLWIARPIYIFWMICNPLIKTLDFIALHAVRLVGVHTASESEVAHSAEEIKIIADESMKGGEIDSTESEIIHNAVDFGAIVAKEVMTPRKRLICLNKQRPLEENLTVVRDSKHTRFPYIDGSKDHVLGMIHIHDLLQCALRSEQPDLDKLCRRFIIVPENSSISNILKMMNKEGISAALVLDEYGGTAGILTMEDIVEEVMGHMHDEHDNSVPECKKLSDTEYEFSGRYEIASIAEMVGRPFDTEQVTIGGYVFNLFQRLPVVGDKIEDENFLFEIVKMHTASVGTVKLTIKDRSGAARPAAAEQT